MNTLTLLLLVLIVVGLGFYFLRPQMRGWQGPKPLANPNPQPTPPGGVPMSPDLGALKIGDALSFWDGTDATVQGALDCREEVGGRVTEWRWLFLTGDRVLELLPHGQALYEAGAIFYQGDEGYEGVTAQLRKFEGNVREGIAHEPVLLNVDDADYRVRSTGTFLATASGQLPEVWSDVGPDPSKNTYFKLVRDDDPKDVVVGIWTTHIRVCGGRVIDRSEITNVFGAAR